MNFACKGASYEEIAKAGGGIVSTVEGTRKASEEDLLADALARVDAMIAEGVMTIEIKSGYGLDIETELKMLKVARQIENHRNVRIITSFLGAHAVPVEYHGEPDTYIDKICIPTLEKAASLGLIDAVDGFCESIAFTPQQIERVFAKAKELGIPVKLHAEQLSNLGGAKLAARFGALSVDHLEYLDEEGVKAMAEAGSIAVILPGAFYTLRETQLPPIDLFRKHNVPMAVATDCNPGSSPLASILLTLNMACTLFRMTPEEALAGCTRNAALALGLDAIGMLEAGNRAELAIWDVEHPAELCYRIGFNSLVERIVPTIRDMNMSVLSPGNVTLSQLEGVIQSKDTITLDTSFKPAIEASAELVRRAASGENPVYGVNTGFGKLASVKITPDKTAQLQRNLILSHCSGVGEITPPEITRLMMVLKLLSLGRGASGVSWQLIELLEAMINKDVMPVIPSQGSVGASGDLAPLAHMAAVMIGEGEVFSNGEKIPGKKALASAGLKPIELGPKEGLALINGTQFSTACALYSLFAGWRNAKVAILTSAMSTDAIMGSTAPLLPQIHELRGHRGQIEVANNMRALMAGSQIRESHREDDTRVQDPYCIRCQPQVTGACIDLLRHAGKTLEVEANAVTDNPLVLVGEERIASGGNFHAEPVGFAADQIALAIAEIGAIAQRRVALMVDPVLSFDLPPFLTPDPGLNSGFMIAEVTTAALMSENKHLANPCTTDSTPTSANQEDHVSMAAHAAWRFKTDEQKPLGHSGGRITLCGPWH